MTSRRIAFAFAFALTVLALSARVVRAEETASEAIRVRVMGDARCTDEPGFFAALRARGASVREASHDEPAHTFVVETSRADAEKAVTGSIVLTDDHGFTSAPRTVRGRSCAEAVGALALIAALSVEADVAKARAAAVAEAPAEKDALDRARESIVSSPPAIGAAQVTPGPTPPPPLPVSARRSPVISVGAGIDAVTPVSGLSAAPHVFLDLATADGARVWTTVAFAPSLRVSASYVGSATGEGDEHAAFYWATGLVDGCAVAYWRLRGCAEVEAGWLHTSPDGLGTYDRTRPWVAAGLLARLRAVTVDRFFLDVNLGAKVPLVRERFAVTPDTAVYRAPLVIGRGGIDLGVRFP